MRTRSWPLLAIVAVASLVLFTNLGGATLWDIDEPRNAGCAREMLERHDWIVPTFNGELRAHKPVLLYWFMMTAYSVVGVNEFGARFWSAVFGVGTVLLTYAVGRRLFNPRVGFMAGIALATCLNFGVVARAATPDSIFVFFVTLAVALFAIFANRSPGRDGTTESWQELSWGGWIAVYAAMGMAVLAKGPAGLVLPLGVIGLWRMVDGRRVIPASALPPGRLARLMHWIGSVFTPSNFVNAAWSMRPLTALVVVAVIALPWYAAVAQATGGEWINEFWDQHNVKRFTSTMENHSGPPFYYLIVICIGFFPWSLFIAPTILELAGRGDQHVAVRRNYRFLSCWALLYIVFFSLASTKLPNYVMPAYPALAIATGCWIDRLLAQRLATDVRWLRRATASLAVVGVGLIAGLAWAANEFLAGDTIIALVGVTPVVAGLVTYWLARQTQLERSLMAFGVAALVLVVSALGFAVKRVDNHQRTEELLAKIHSLSDGPPSIAAYRFFRPSWVFYYGEPIREFTEPTEADQFFRSSPDGFLLTNERQLARLQSNFPGRLETVASVPQFLKKGEILVVRQATATARTPQRAATRAH